MRLFLTGASGILGSELVPHLLQQGHVVYALCRQPLKLRHERLHEVRGDVTQNNLGTTFPESFDTFVHLAAITSLSQKDADHTMLVNVQGTARALEFAQEHGAGQFHYVSTLYIAGDHRGPFGEDDFDVGQTHRNPYERSKFLAETWLRGQSKTPVSYYRCGIIVGSGEDGRIQSFSGYYKPIQAIMMAHRMFERKLRFPERYKVEDALHVPRLNVPIRIWGDPQSTLALTPVDGAAKLMAHLMEEGPGTYHIVPEQQVPNWLTAEVICEALHLDGFHFSPEHRKSPLDSLYNRMIHDFLPYVAAEPRFQTQTPTTPGIDRAALLRILRYWRTHEVDAAPVAEKVDSAV